MKAKKENGAVDPTGSTFDSFLEEEGIRQEVEAVAIKRVISWQLSQVVEGATQALARKRNTSA